MKKILTLATITTLALTLATAPHAMADEPYYKNCAAAREAGAAPLHRGDPGYSTNPDRDGDGIACE